ncbi:MAG: S41 family peptidase [Bacteroidales bacterium]|nr:S41 family peptidase [Bacteroidales bacterium]
MALLYCKYTIFVFIILCSTSIITAQEKPDDWMFNPKGEMNRNDLINFWNSDGKLILGRNNICESDFIARADSALNSYPNVSINITELVKLYRGAFDLFTLEDPHFRIYPQFIRNADNTEATKRNFGKYILALPFNLLQVNDSLIIDKTLSNKLSKGDLILSINGINAKDLLDYTYRDRYIDASLLQLQYHMMFCRHYDLVLLRHGKKIHMNVAGIPLNDYLKYLANYQEVNRKMLGNIGYIEITRFNKNKYIISELKKIIKQVKVNGGHSVIIDLRRNPGGNGDNFDKLISLFTTKEEIDYQNDVKVMISEKTIPHYGYPDSIGKLVTLPDSEVIKRIPLKPKMYMGEMNYYVLISQSTGSMASTFANILQYNNLGILVGEPMRHNALRYGEVAEGNSPIVRLIYSTVEYSEFTKSPDGNIYPDIHIPYIASEYISGRDPVLEKLLEIIKAVVNE